MTTTRHFAAGRNCEATVITAVLALPCGLACAGSVAPGLDAAVTTVVAVLAALTLTAVGLQWAVRWVWERREDAADAITATRWRATYAPHLLTTVDRARLGAPRTAAVGHDCRAVA